MRRGKSQTLLLIAVALFVTIPFASTTVAQETPTASNEPATSAEAPSAEPVPENAPVGSPEQAVLFGYLDGPRTLNGGAATTVTGIIGNDGNEISDATNARLVWEKGHKSGTIVEFEVPILEPEAHFPLEINWEPEPGLVQIHLFVDAVSTESPAATAWYDVKHAAAKYHASPIKVFAQDEAEVSTSEIQIEEGDRKVKIKLDKVSRDVTSAEIDREWLDSRVPGVALEDGTFTTTVRDGEEKYVVPLEKGQSHLTFKSANPTTHKQEFTRGSADSILFTERPMAVRIVSTPRFYDSTQTVTTENGTFENVARTSDANLSIDFDDGNHNGQPILIHKDWLAGYGIEAAAFAHENGDLILATQVGDYYLIKPTHFSVIHSFSGSNGMWGQVATDTNSDVSIAGGVVSMYVNRVDTRDETLLRNFVPHAQYTVEAQFTVTTAGRWQSFYPLAIGNRAERTNPDAAEHWSPVNSFGFMYYGQDSYGTSQLRAYYRVEGQAGQLVWTNAIPVPLGTTMKLKIQVTATSTFFSVWNAAGTTWYQSGSVSNSVLPMSAINAIFIASEEGVYDSYETPTQATVDEMKISIQAGGLINNDFSSSTGFSLSGNAAVTGGVLRLTSNSLGQVGRAVSTTGTTNSRISIEYRYTIGPNSGGADGLVFFFYKDTSYTPANGGEMGFQDLTPGNSGHMGYGIEIDTYQGLNDGVPDEFSLVQDHNTNHLLQLSGANPPLKGSHTINVEIWDSKIFFFKDDAYMTYLDLPAHLGIPDFSRAYSGIGFAAATGGLTNQHDIDYLRVSVAQAPANTAPTARIWGPSSAVVGTNVFLSGYDSSDDSTTREQLQYRWDWDGNGFDTGYTQGQYDVFHQYNTVGSNTVRLQVKDLQGLESNIATLPLNIYNTAPNVPANPTPINGATGQSISVSLGWTGGDADSGQTVRYQVYLSTANPPPMTTPVAGCDQITSTSCSVSGLQFTTTYFWIVRSSDGYTTSQNSAWQFSTGVNQAPRAPTNPNPGSTLTARATSLTASWQNNGDPDPQSVTFTVYRDTTNPPTTAITGCIGITSTSCAFNSMVLGTVYYWKVVASDGSLQTSSDVWWFRTNYAPNTPQFPSPTDGATNQLWSITASWTGGDQDSSQTVTSTVFRRQGTTSPFTQVCQVTSTTCPQWTGLTRGVTYQWYVRAADPMGASVDGPIWSFSTKANTPPGSSNCFSAGTTDVTVSVTWNNQCNDIDGDTLEYTWQWGDGTSTGPGQGPAFTSLSHAYKYPWCPGPQNPTVQVIVFDGFGGSGGSTQQVSIVDNRDPDGDGLKTCLETETNQQTDPLLSDSDGDSVGEEYAEVVPLPRTCPPGREDPSSSNKCLRGSDYVESPFWSGRQDLFCPSGATAPNCLPNARHKDLYVEIDYMSSGTSTSDAQHAPNSATLGRMVQTFAGADVLNPDGTAGIILHLDLGALGGTNYNLGGGNRVTHDDSLGSWGTVNRPIGGPVTCQNFDMTQLWTIKNTAVSSGGGGFDYGRRDRTYHYALVAHHQADVPECYSSGRAPQPGRDLLMTLGNTGEHGSQEQREGTLVHELGHNLGLGHGGATDGTNGKPNYLSVMNYAHQFDGVERTDGSRYYGYSTHQLPDLNEDALDERIGLNHFSITNQRIRWFCTPLGATSPVEQKTAAGTGGRLNWDCDKQLPPNQAQDHIEASVVVDLNKDGATNWLLGAPVDWRQIQYQGIETTSVPGAYTAFDPLPPEWLMEMGLRLCHTGEFTHYCPLAGNPE